MDSLFCCKALRKQLEYSRSRRESYEENKEAEYYLGKKEV